jgi:hypothetical protein
MPLAMGGKSRWRALPHPLWRASAIHLRQQPLQRSIAPISVWKRSMLLKAVARGGY